ncbi:hypothetical protein LUZ60_007294 [Juncus effusus]|nr:hypothetical protein LUZ60_007294 [Juncus effusus]
MSKSAVDDIIAQAMDSIALDHITKLNTAHLSSPSLPSDLESRFRKLKSFPSSSSSSSSAPIPPTPPTITASRSLPTGKENTAPVPEPEPAPPVEVVDQEKTAFQMETPSVQTKSPHKPKPSLPNLHSNGSRGISLSPSKKRDPSSPTYQQGCCFPFSPKKTLITSIISPKSKAKDRNAKERNDELDLDNVNEWGDMNKKMVGEIKEQQRKLKKALKEQEKVSKEAAKMVRLVKHSSARMTHDINHDDLFSDDEDDDDDHFSKI